MEWNLPAVYNHFRAGLVSQAGVNCQKVPTIFFRICAQGLRYLAQDFLTRISQPLGSIKLVDDRLTWTCGSDSVQAVAPDWMIVEQLPIRALPVFNRTAAPEMMQLAHRNLAGQGAQGVSQNC